MSATLMAYHLGEAATSLRVARHHLRDARDADPDPEVAGEVYGVMLTNVALLLTYCDGLRVSRQPDLDREAAAMDALAQPGAERGR